MTEEKDLEIVLKEVFDKELGRLKRLGKEVLHDEFEVEKEAVNCPCCNQVLTVVICYIRKAERGRFRHKHRIFNLSKMKFEGGWT